MDIPKIIHQIWFGDSSKRPDNLIQSWRYHHPQWKHILWTEENLFQLECAKQFQQAYPRFNMQADIARYEILYRCGGIYVDADSLCLRPMDDLIHHKFFAVHENHKKYPDLIANGVIGCHAYDPIMEKLIAHISTMTITKKMQAWIETGPVLFTQYLKTESYPTILQSDTFYPLHFEKTRQPDLLRTNFPNAYSIQFWASTNNTYDQLKRIHYDDPAEARPGN